MIIHCPECGAPMSEDESEVIDGVVVCDGCAEHVFGMGEETDED